MRAMHAEDFSSLQLCGKPKKSKSKRFDNEMKLFKMFLHFCCMTQYTVRNFQVNV